MGSLGSSHTKSFSLLGGMVFKNASVLKLIVTRLYLQNQCMQLMTSAAIANLAIIIIFLVY